MSEELTHCPVCGFHDFKQYPRQEDMYFFECGRCGEYVISWEMLHTIPALKQEQNVIKIALSGLARELYETKQTVPTFLTTNFEQLATSYPVPDLNSIEDKALKLLQRVKEKTTYFGEKVDLGDAEVAYPLAYAMNRQEFWALCEFLQSKGMASFEKYQMSNCISARIQLTSDGWDTARKLGVKNEKSQKGFVAIWFDDSMNDSINAIEGAIREVGFTPICIRDEHFSQRIMDKALGEIRESRFVVVDLTGGRSSVFFEAGFAHGLGIETIYVFKDGGDEGSLPLEFYVRHYQCYRYKGADDLKSILIDAIRARIVT